MGVMEIPLGFRGVLSVSSSVIVVLVVTDSPLIVSGFGENILSDSECDFVESETIFSLQKCVTRFVLKVKKR